nr:MAG TPA: hypothetical protein [Caudoviricetes sp.]
MGRLSGMLGWGDESLPFQAYSDRRRIFILST